MDDIFFHYDEALHSRQAQLKKPTFLVLGISHIVLASVILYKYYGTDEGGNFELFTGYGLTFTSLAQIFVFLRAQRVELPAEGVQYIKIEDKVLQYKHPDRAEAILIPLENMQNIQLTEKGLEITPRDDNMIVLPLQISDRKKRRNLKKIIANLQQKLSISNAA